MSMSQSARSKEAMRSASLQKRKAMLGDPDGKEALDLEIQSRFLMTREYRSASTVLCYVSKKLEIDTEGIILASFANGKRVAVPRCEEDGTLRFFIISSLSDLREGSFHIREPKESCSPLLDESLSVCVCPALCCDMRGYRIGFGKGYYDRFLKDYTGQAVALCYSDSLIPEIQIGEHDIMTQMIVTDSFVRHI